MTTSNPLAWSELALLEGPDFIRACYRAVLQREPDESGFIHHVDALAQGESKAAVTASIASGEEACLTGSAFAPIAVRARDERFRERGDLPSWAYRVPFAKLYRRKEERALRKRAREIQARHRQLAGPDCREAGPAVRLRRIPAADWQAALRRCHSRAGSGPDFWLDLTTAFQWTGGVVGIVRAELELACGLKKVLPSARFSMQADHGFVEIEASEIQWLLEAGNVADAYMKFFGRYPGLAASAKTITVDAPDVEGFFHPYRPGDMIVAAGWMDSQKEHYFSRLKQELPQVYLAYLIYDIIMLLDETRHFYPREGRRRFADYIHWASANCDFLLYGGETAQRDTQAFLTAQGWRVPPGQPVRFGTDIVKTPTGAGGKALIEGLGVGERFILTVGSIEPRKNHETLYRAYLMALEEDPENLPQLVIVGKPMWRADDLMNILTRHPQLKGRVLCLRPTDLELAALYENCLFTVLPSLYEGWSLTLPESLGQGKFCLCSDTPPLREIGRSLADYVPPFDVRGWAEKILLYSIDEKLLAKVTRKVVEDWPSTHWIDTAAMVHAAVEKFSSANSPIVPMSVEQGDSGSPLAGASGPKSPTIWMDLTLSYLNWTGGVSGIVRAELEFARHLKQLRPDTRFFAYQTYHDYFFEIDAGYLKWLFDAEDIAKAYKSFHDFWLPREEKGEAFRNPFFENQRPVVNHPAFIPAFPENSIVFFAGIDSDGSGTLHRSKDVDALIAPGSGVIKSQLIYDLTPIDFPHFHTEQTCVGFKSFFEHVSNHFDHIVYGGRTARDDGQRVEDRFGWKQPLSGFVEFGSDVLSGLSPEDSRSKAFQSDEVILRGLGVDSDFAMCVGTIEPRKNHEVLYKAYLTLLRERALKKPLQLVFVGKPGWNSTDFLATLEDDDRVRGKILILSPTDRELDLLYRRCLFTLLPTFYEGWSLTLPESLSYGKLCLASDVAPLREIGGDLIDYVHPLDTFGWAKGIAALANDPGRRRTMEAKIQKEWRPRTWGDSAAMLGDELERAYRILADRHRS